MKLSSFLIEESLDQLDISPYLKGLDPNEVMVVKELLDKFKKFNKITLDDINEDEMFLHVTDGIVDIDFTFTKDEDQGALRAAVEIASMVNHKFVYGHEKLSEHDAHKYALTQTFSRDFAVSRSQRLLEYADYIVDVAEKFNDWYFDMSGEYGKMKLIKTPYDVIDGSSNNEWKWIPVAGIFFAAGQTGNDKVRAEVL